MTDEEKLPWVTYELGIPRINELNWDKGVLKLALVPEDQARALYRGAKRAIELFDRKGMRGTIEETDVRDLLKKGLGLDDEKACKHDGGTIVNVPLYGDKEFCAKCGAEK